MGTERIERFQTSSSVRQLLSDSPPHRPVRTHVDLIRCSKPPSRFGRHETPLPNTRTTRSSNQYPCIIF
jgi:hypothetical protein